MPLYAYKCSNCEYEFDKILPVSRKDEPKNSPCPNCEELSVQEHITGSNFQLKDVQRSSEFNDLLKSVHQKNSVPKVPGA